MKIKLLGALAFSAPNLQLSPAFAQGTGYGLVTTITNPTPAYLDNFGSSVAGVGTDRVLIGAPYDDTGTTDAGAAYLFSTNGTLLTTFTSPVPDYEAFFGMTLTAVGTDAVLIGAPYASIGAEDAGAAYLFSTNGTWITTFTNPAPNKQGQFGRSLAAVGTDRVLVAAPMNDLLAANAGAAYLFRTNGTLLTTFTNPTPAMDDNFGWPLAAVGTDLVLIACPRDSDMGAAYLFNTNGVLLRTFKSPSPAQWEAFGDTVAAVGNDRVLIGADGNSIPVTYAGAAYLFSTNGTLLNTFTNPTPADSDHFGWGLTAVGTNYIVIGAWKDDTGAMDAGAAYLYGPPIPPSLSICLTTTNTAAVLWPSPSTGWTLQENTNGLSSVNWSNASGLIQDIGTNRILIVNPPTGARFYRLIKPGS